MNRYLRFLFLGGLMGCAQGWLRHSPALEEDRSIVFPQFFAQDAVEVGRPDQMYQLDGTLLKAIAIAANDFLPSDRSDTPCSDRQEAHFYRVIRRGNIFFVRIDENPKFCGHTYVSLDAGIQYAISLDGRILRRISDGMGKPTYTAPAASAVPGEPGISSTFDPEHAQPLPFMRSRAEDGGIPDATVP